MPTSVLLRAAACLAGNCNHGFYRARYPQQALSRDHRDGADDSQQQSEKDSDVIYKAMGLHRPKP